MKVYKNLEEFKRAFRKMGKFVAVNNWTYGETPQATYLFVVVFENGRKVRFETEPLINRNGSGLGVLSVVCDLVEENRQVHCVI